MHVVAYIISPIHVISAIAAIRARHKRKSVRITLAVHWPGTNAQHVQELHDIVCDMTRRIDGIEACIAIPNEALNPLAGRDAEAVSPQLRSLIGTHEFAEIYYAHDVIGMLYAMLAQSYPAATRICFGDGLGNVYERHHHLGLLGIDVPRAPPVRRSAQGFGLVRYVRNLLTTNDSGAVHEDSVELAKLPFGLSSIPPDCATLILPIDQSAKFLRNVPLQVVPRALVRQVLEEIAASCVSLQAHVAELVERIQRRPKPAFVLMTENNAEGKFMSFERDVDMYCAIIKRYCGGGSSVVLKSHPGEDLPRNAAIRERLSDAYDIVEFSPALKRYPIELAGDLIRRCTLICMSYPTLSLKYLFDLDVIQPMDEAFIERWYPEQFWASYKNAVSLYRQPLLRLSSWNGRGVLWSGERETVRK